MRLKGSNLKSVYSVISKTYEDKVGTPLKFKSGEKGRAKNIFTYVSEAMGIRDDERFEEVLDMFIKYVEAKTKEWLGWRARSRRNWFGFLENSEEIEVFVAGKLSTPSQPDKNIAGTGGAEEWDDF